MFSTHSTRPEVGVRGWFTRQKNCLPLVASPILMSVASLSTFCHSEELLTIAVHLCIFSLLNLPPHCVGAYRVCKTRIQFRSKFCSFCLSASIICSYDLWCGTRGTNNIATLLTDTPAGEHQQFVLFQTIRSDIPHLYQLRMSTTKLLIRTNAIGTYQTWHTGACFCSILFPYFCSITV